VHIKEWSTPAYSKSLSLFIDASNEVEKRASSVCSAVTDIFKSAAAGQPRLMVGEPVSLTVKLNSPKMNSSRLPGKGHLYDKATIRQLALRSFVDE
jgi:hypothetical protein